MIELGHLRIETEASIVDAREKVAALCEALKFDAVAVSRMAIAVSQLCRTAVAHCEMFYLDIGLESREQQFGISLVFNEADSARLTELAEQLARGRHEDPRHLMRR